MKQYQLRVVEEKEDLDIKIEKLREFQKGDVWKKLSDREQILLDCQARFMVSYSRILGDRIAAFKDT